MTDRFDIRIAPHHITMAMASRWLEQLLADNKANPASTPAVEAELQRRLTGMESQFEHLRKELDKWAQEHDIDILWTESLGRRTHKRNYRVAWEPAGRDTTAMLDALDAEILRLSQ